MVSKYLVNLPKTVDVGWTSFDIVLTRGLSVEGTPCFGLTDFDSHVIQIDDSVSDNSARYTIIHEIAHVLLSTVGLGEECLEESGIEVTNEFLAESLGRSFLLFHNLNHELWDYLFTNHKEVTKNVSS